MLSKIRLDQQNKVVCLDQGATEIQRFSYSLSSVESVLDVNIQSKN